MATLGKTVLLPAAPQTILISDHLPPQPHLPGTSTLWPSIDDLTRYILARFPAAPTSDPYFATSFLQLHRHTVYIFLWILLSYSVSQLPHHKYLLLTVCTTSECCLLFHYLVLCHAFDPVVEYLCKKLTWDASKPIPQ